MTTLTNDLPFLSSLECAAAVSCSPIGPGLGGVKMGLGSTGKLGRAWVMVHGMVTVDATKMNFHFMGQPTLNDVTIPQPPEPHSHIIY